MTSSRERRRILYLEANTDGTTGGSHRALFDLVRSLRGERFTPVVAFYQDNPYVARMRQLGVKVLLLDEIFEYEVEIYHAAPEWRRLWEKGAAVLRRRKLLAEHEIDLLHVINSPCVAFMDWLPAAKLAGIPAVSGAMGTGESVYYGKPIYRWLMDRFDRILAVSRHTARRLEEIGLDPRSITVVHHGVDLSRLRDAVSRSRETVRGELDVGGDELLVTMIANIRQWKGQYLLLEAVLDLERSLRDRVHVAFAGGTRSEDTAYESRLQELAASEGLEDRVKFLGFREDAPDLMEASDVVVHASVQPEPGGISVLEALALGRPVVAADTGGHTEVIEDGCGVLFETGSAQALARALSGLLTDPERRERIGARAAERMREFSTERNARETEAVYDDLLN